MPKIIIVESDQTRAGVFAESTDVVYIPGFVDVTQFDSVDKPLEINRPHLFTSLNEFESLCGSRGGVFKTPQYYRDISTLERPGFSSVAIPYSGVMFSANTVDPSYVMAKELLAAGLNVLYERVNPDETFGPEFKGTEPEDWTDHKTEYQVRATVYKHVTSSTPPEFFDPSEVKNTDIDNGVIKAHGDASKDYYTRHVVNNTKLQFFRENGNAYDETKTYYVRSSSAYGFAEDQATETFDATLPYMIPDPVRGFIPVTLSEEPGDWGTSGKYFLVMLIEPGSGVTPTGETYVEIPSEWITNYYQGYEVVQEFVPVQESDSFDSTATYRHVDSGISIKVMYDALEEVFSASEDGLSDKGNYSIKYLTSGGYPVYEYNNGSIVTKMLNIATSRGDCVAYIDHTDNPYRDDNIDHATSIYQTVVHDDTFAQHGEFATMFTPWATYNRSTIDTDGVVNINSPTSVRMSASFAYFLALASSIKTNANWISIAGSARGVVPHLAQNGMTTNIPNGAADRMQPRDGTAVNAITNIQPYGYTIWGNRTLKNNGVEGNLTATSFLNIRNLVSDVKKICYRAARKLTFEQNNDVLWVNFKSEIVPLLDRMQSGYGISGYKLVRDTTHEKAAEKATLCAKVILYPVYAVEDFYISIVLTDDEINIE